MVDLRNEFVGKVIEPFVDAYRKGVTPNPCILCNRYIKFPHLLMIADERGAEFMATGHYARIEKSDKLQVTSNKSNEKLKNSSLDSRHSLLKKGIDPRKDQSYVLYALRRQELRRLILPLGEKIKDEVRRTATKLNLSAAARPESQEICFIEEKNYFSFIDNLSKDKGPGPIIDFETGKLLGSHKGIHTYTVGQRKGLGISSPEPLYVVKIDAAMNTIYVGGKNAAKMKEFVAEDVNWLNIPSSLRGEPACPVGRGEGGRAGMILHPPLDSLPSPHSGGFAEAKREGRVDIFRASVKVRSTMKDEPATITILGDKIKVVYDEPQWAPAAGQSAVFYDGDIVVGGGVITGPVFKE